MFAIIVVSLSCASSLRSITSFGLVLVFVSKPALVVGSVLVVKVVVLVFMIVMLVASACTNADIATFRKHGR